MIIQHKVFRMYFEQIQKVCEFCFFGKKIQINKIRSWVYLPALRASANKKTRYTLKIGDAK